MKPYDYINHMIREIAIDCMQVDVEHYTFDNDARWNDSTHLFGPTATEGWGGRFGNIKPSKCTIDNKTWYDYYNRKWKAWGDFSRILPSIIDHSFEPINYHMDITLWDHAYKDYHPWPGLRIPNDPLTSLEIKDYPIYVLHSEHNSKDIKKLNNLGYLDIHWFSHAYICSEFYFKHYCKLPSVKKYLDRPVQYRWICANRLLRQHRTDFLEMLNLDRGCYSLLNPDPNGLSYRGPVPACSFDDHTNSSAEIEVNYLTPWNTSFLHVVTETVWQEKIHFTEKVFKPIVLHQPFVVLQAPESLAYLRSYGFKTFGAWWDESYDTIEDPTERMQAIADIVNSIGAKSLEELETMRMEMASVLEHNFRHFYENIPAICLDELRKGIANL